MVSQTSTGISVNVGNLAICGLPSFCSICLDGYPWKNGIVNSILLSLNLINEPLAILYRQLFI